MLISLIVEEAGRIAIALESTAFEYLQDIRKYLLNLLRKGIIED